MVENGVLAKRRGDTNPNSNDHRNRERGTHEFESRQYSLP